MSSLPEEWVETTLANIIATANTGLDAIKRAPIVIEDTGIRCFRIQDASQSKEYIRWGFTNVNQQNYDKFKLLTGDILIARTGNSIGVNFLVQYDTKAVFNNGLIRLRVNEFVRYDFLYKIISSHVFDRYIQSIAYGTSTQPNMQINSLLNFNLLLPPLPEQKSIANILSSFDEKIELLREQNETLETLAQTIFKEWFVDFNYPDATGEMVGSEFGEIPKGWRVCCIYDFAKYINGAAYKNIHFSKESTGLPVIKIVELKSGISKQTKFTEIDLGEKFKIDNGDILFSWSGSPETSIDIFIWTLGEAYLNQHIFKVIPNENLGKYYVYNALKYLKPTFVSIAKMKQTTGLGHVTISDLKKLLFVVPDKLTLESFSEVIKPIYEKKYQATSQIQTLTKTRDTLLPKLMRGEIRVSI